jgi:hypothetical protein
MSAALAWNFWFWASLAGYTLACIGAGSLLLRVVGSTATPDPGKSPLVSLSIAFVVGLGALGQAWVLLALGGHLTRVVVVPLLGVMILAALSLFRRQGAQMAVGLRGTFRELSRMRWGLLLVLACVVASLAWSFTSLGREFSGDPLALHMVVGKAAAASGKLERYWFQSVNEAYGLMGADLCGVDADR